MKTRMKLLLAVLLIVIAAGPAYPVDKEMLQLQKDVIDLVAQVKVMQSTIDSNNAMMKGLMEKMADQVNTLSTSVVKINQTVDGLKTQNDGTTKELRTILTNLNTTVGDLQENVTSIRSQMNSLANQVTSMKTTTEPLAKPDDLWRTAFADYNAGNYDLAIGDIQDFLSKYPADQRAAWAHLMIGDSLYNQKKYDQAIPEYDIVLQKYPDSDKTSAALLKKGLAQAATNQPQAVVTLKEVVSKFPHTPEAETAASALKTLAPATPARRGPARPGDGK